MQAKHELQRGLDERVRGRRLGRVADGDGEAAPGHTEDWRVEKVGAEAHRVEGGGGDDDATQPARRLDAVGILLIGALGVLCPSLGEHALGERE